MNIFVYVCLLVGFRLASSSSLQNHFLNNLTRFDYETLADPETPETHQAIIGAKRCMRELGCFEITKDFFHPLYRPINFLPNDRSTINTKFLLYTKHQPKEPQIIHATEPEEIRNSHIDPAYKTIFIIHGFFDSRYYGKWMEIMKDNLLLHDQYNIIIVDWSGGNGAPYTQATANSRVVGAEVALFIKKLIRLKNVAPMDCQIIGHSLGAHIAGYAGERLTNLGRITSLDAAQPYFQFMPPSVRVDPTDADFVDAIHTDSASDKFLPLGMSQAVGHIDFYPNNGMSQPGCSYSAIHSIFLDGLIDAVRQFVACNHQRAVDFYLYSINYKKILPVAYQCVSWNAFSNGHCSDCGNDGSRCALLGIHADKYKPYINDSRSVKMYLATSNSPPFWTYSYQIQVKLSKPKTNYEDKAGYLTLKLYGSESTYNLQLSSKTGNLIHGATYTFLVHKTKQLGELQSVIFSWTSSSWNFFKTHTLYLDFVKIVPMNIDNQKQQRLESRKFCYTPGRAIKSKNEIILAECK